MRQKMRFAFLIILLIVVNCSMGKEVDGGNGHSIFLDKNHRVWTVGRNDHGQLGNGTFQNSSIPILVEGLPQIQKISRGYDFSLAIDIVGGIWVWGANTKGQLGVTDSLNLTRPRKLNFGADFKAIEGAYMHTVALRGNGTVFAWGQNKDNELGSSISGDSYKPLQVLAYTDKQGLSNELEPLKNIVDIKSVGAHTLALDSFGNVWGWGPNCFYQINPDKNKNFIAAILIKGIPKIKAISVGWHHSIALDSLGNLWAWGSDPSGQFRESTTKFFNIPVCFQDLPSMTKISCGSWHSLAIDKNGRLWTWGKNHFGMLGSGDTISTSLPIMNKDLKGVCEIGAGCFQSVIVDSTGCIWSFGDNPSGQLGLYDHSRRLVPAKSLLSINGRLAKKRIKDVEKDNFWRSISLNNFYALIRNHPIVTTNIITLIVCLFIFGKKRKSGIVK